MKREDVSKIFENATEEQISKLLDINSADIGAAKKKLEAERDNYKTMLDTANETLKTFEGVDVTELQGKVKALQNDLKTAQEDYEGKIADMEFSSALSAAIGKSGAKSEKAVRAFLDLEALKVSKNREADIAAALDKVKSENDYLFTSNEPVKKPIAPTGTGKHTTLSGVEKAFFERNPSLKID